jgi:hypothetical protein
LGSEPAVAKKDQGVNREIGLRRVARFGKLGRLKAFVSPAATEGGWETALW